MACKFAKGDTVVLAEPYRPRVETTVEKVGNKYVGVALSKRRFTFDGVQAEAIYGQPARIYTLDEYAEAMRRNEVEQRIAERLRDWRKLPLPALERLLAELDAAAR